MYTVHLNRFVLVFPFVPEALIAPDLKVTHFCFICSALNQLSLWFRKGGQILEYVNVLPLTLSFDKSA